MKLPSARTGAIPTRSRPIHQTQIRLIPAPPHHLMSTTGLGPTLFPVTTRRAEMPLAHLPCSDHLRPGPLLSAHESRPQMRRHKLVRLWRHHRYRSFLLPFLTQNRRSSSAASPPQRPKRNRVQTGLLRPDRI